MGFEFFKESYTGSVKEIPLGKGDSAVTVGGETCYPFCQFEGDMPNKPRIAMEIWDMEPDEWPAAALEPFKDVVSDPAAWAKKCVDEYGAEMIVLQLKSTDPNGQDASPEKAAATVKNCGRDFSVYMSGVLVMILADILEAHKKTGPLAGAGANSLKTPDKSKQRGVCGLWPVLPSGHDVHPRMTSGNGTRDGVF